MNTMRKPDFIFASPEDLQDLSPILYMMSQCRYIIVTTYV